ncbi:MAG: pentapeptide repeat-containing protein [Rhodovibrio sp.]|nr:pentapeptide repeat-containing protein [Rhodovibrio sp.]
MRATSRRSPARPPSDETLDFCRAAAEQKGQIDALDRAVSGILLSDASTGREDWPYEILGRAIGDVRIPRGANLSDLDLRDLDIPNGAVWEDIRLHGAVLTGQQMRGVDFRGVSFEGDLAG